MSEVGSADRAEQRCGYELPGAVANWTLPLRYLYGPAGLRWRGKKGEMSQAVVCFRQRQGMGFGMYHLITCGWRIVYVCADGTVVVVVVVVVVDDDDEPARVQGRTVDPGNGNITAL